MHTLILVAKRATARPIPFNRQDRMNRHTIRYALILVAALAVAALAVARFDGLCSIFSTVWSALEPLAIGAVLAYLLNFIAAALESRWFPHTNNTLAIKTRRPICVILAIAAVTLALAALTAFVGGEFKSVGAAIITGISEAAAMASQAIANLPGAQAIPILDNATWNSIGQKALDAMGGTDQALRIVAQTSGEVAHLTLSILLGMVFALYLLLDKDRVHAGAMRAASFIPGEDLRRRLPGELDAEQMAAALRGKGQRGAAQNQMAGRHALGRQDESRPRRGRPGSGQGSRAFSAGDQAHPQPFARQREGAFGLDILHRGQRCGGAPIKNQYLTPQINKMLFYITK